MWYLYVLTSYEAKSQIIFFQSAGFSNHLGVLQSMTRCHLCVWKVFWCPVAPKHTTYVLTVPVPDSVLVEKTEMERTDDQVDLCRCPSWSITCAASGLQSPVCAFLVRCVLWRRLGISLRVPEKARWLIEREAGPWNTAAEITFLLWKGREQREGGKE